MRGNAVARNYAEVLFDLVSREGGREALERYDAIVEEIRTLFAESPRLRSFFANPRVEVARKEDLVRRAFEGRVPKTLLHFLLVAVRKGRGTAIGSIADEFRVLVDERLKRMRVEVLLARQADAATRERIEEALERRFGQSMLVDYTVDEDVLGGLVVRARDEVLDGSLRRQLAELRRRMAGARLPTVA